MPEEEKPVVTPASADATPTVTPGAQGLTPTPAATADAQPAKVIADPAKRKLEDFPEEIRDYVKSLRTEAETNRKKAAELENAQKDQETKDLEAKQEWQKLADARLVEINQLKPKAEEATQLAELLTAQLNKEIEKWPEEVKATAPDGAVSPLEMIKWADKVRPLAERLMTNSETPPAKPVPKGNTPGPTPLSSGNKPTADTSKQPLVEIERRF